MLPRIVIGQNKADFDAYIDQFLSENKAYIATKYSIEPTDKNSITVDQIRELKKELKVKTLARFVCISSFDCATLEAQNALLKTLEEKSEHNVFILGVQNIGEVLPTIISRCMLVTLSHDQLVSKRRIEVEKLIDSLSQPQTYTILQDSIMQPAHAQEASEILIEILLILQEKIKTGNMMALGSAKIAFELLQLLQHNNLNHQLTLDNWYLRSKKIFCQ